MRRRHTESVGVSSLLLDRPALAADPILLHAFARRSRPLAASEVFSALSGTGATLSDALENLARARTAGLVGANGFRGNTLLLELTDLGRAAVAADRRADDMSRIRWDV